MSSIWLKTTVRAEMSGRPSIKELRGALTQVAKHVNPDAKVTLKETMMADRPTAVHFSIIETTYGEWS